MRLNFEHAPDGSACAPTSQTARDVVQSVLLGKSIGQGLIPRAPALAMAGGQH
jgi:hypothetical protein